MGNGHVWSHMVTMVIYGHIWSSVSTNYILCKTWFVRKSSASWSKANSLVNSSLYFAFSKNPFNSPNERTPDLHHHQPGCILLLRSNSAQHFHLFSFIFESISNTNSSRWAESSNRKIRHLYFVGLPTIMKTCFQMWKIVKTRSVWMGWLLESVFSTLPWRPEVVLLLR